MFVNKNLKSKTEYSLYFIIWIAGVFYSIYNVFIVSQQFRRIYSPEIYGFIPGWSFIGYLKDYSDYEWSSWMSFSHKLLPWISIHLIGGRIIHYHFKNVLPLWYITIGILFINRYLGHLATIIITLQPCIFYLISEMKNQVILWIFSIITLLFITFDQSTEWLGLSTDDHYLLTLSLSWMHLKCMSFSQEKYISTTDDNPLQEFIYILAYCFYLPNLFLGPLILYNKFLPGITEQYKPWTFNKFSSFILNLIRYIFWLLFTEFSLHFIYSNLLITFPEIVETLGSWALYGLGYCMGQYFMLKYTVVYGIVSTLAKADQMDPPNPPKCIGRIYLYSDMWKYFDQGLYQFLVRYIYVPCLNTSSTLNGKFLATFFCFTFVYIWHRAYTFVFIWSLLNFLGVTIEMLCKNIATTKQYKRIEKNVSPSALRRILAIIASPLFVMSAISNFYFFGGTEIGNIYVKRFLYGDFQVNFILLIFCYTCAQISIQIKQWEQQKTKTNIKHEIN